MKELDKKLLAKLLIKSNSYLKLVRKVSEELVVTEDIVELTSVLYDKPEVLEKELGKLGLDVETNGNLIIINGLYNEKFIYLMLDEHSLSLLDKVREYMMKLNIFKIKYVNNDTNESKTSTIASFITDALAYVTPKNLQRFKGLTRN